MKQHLLSSGYWKTNELFGEKIAVDQDVELVYSDARRLMVGSLFNQKEHHNGKPAPICMQLPMAKIFV